MFKLPTMDELIPKILQGLGLSKEEFVGFANGIGEAVKETRDGIRLLHAKVDANTATLNKILSLVQRDVILDDDELVMRFPPSNAATRERPDWEPGGATEAIVDAEGNRING
jgi:hypothetical protein